MAIGLLIAFNGNCARISCQAADSSCNPFAILAGVRFFPRFIYSRNLTAATITGYSIDYTSGALSSAGFVSGDASSSLSMRPDGALLYSANSAHINTYFINQDSGALTLSNNQSASAPVMFLTDSNGRFGYSFATGSNSIDTYLLNDSGGMSFVSSSTDSGGMNYAAFHPGGRLLYVANSTSGDISTFTVDPSSGATSLLGQAPLAVARSVAIDPFGRFAYATDNTALLKIFQINVDGTLSLLGNATTGTFNTFVCASSDGRFVYTTNQTSADVSVLSVSSTGILTNVANRSAGSGPIGCALDRSGKYAYVNTPVGNVVPYSIDKSTGDLTQLSPIAAGSGAQGLAIQYQPAFP